MDEWRQGTRQTIEFKAAVYESVYETHLAALHSLDEGGSDFIKNLGTELWVDCRYVHFGYVLYEF